MSTSRPKSSSVAPDAWCQVAELLQTDRWSAAIELLRRISCETGCREARITLGGLLAEREQFHEAIQVWTAVIEDAQHDGDREHLSAVYGNLAAVYRDLGDHDLARRFQQQALQLQDDCGADDLLHLANDALAASRWDLAEALLESAADMADDQDPLQVDIVATAGVARLLQRHPDEAITLLLAAYRSHRSDEDHQSAGRDLLNLAGALRQLGRLQLEWKCLSRATDHFERAGCSQSRTMSITRCRQVERLLTLQRTNPQMN